MKNRDTNKLVMFLAVAAYCAASTNKEAVENLKPFLESWHAFLSLVNKLRRRSTSILKLNPSGSTENSQALRKEVAKHSTAISAALVTWARKNGNLALAEQAHLTQSTLINGRAVDAVERAEHILELAHEHVEALKDYKITKQRLTKLDDLTTEFSENIGRPRAIIKARKQARKTLPELFALADVELGHMDRLLILLDDGFEEFIRGFKASRKIDQISASRALSELEKANAAAREAKREVVRAKKAAEVAAKHEEAKATLAEARAIHPATASESGAATEPTNGTRGSSPAAEAADVTGLNA